MLTLAQQQLNSGAHGLDLCVALTERSDEAETMVKLIKTISATIRLPLVIDSTEPDVIEVALQTAPGRCLINSTHLEGGRIKADRILNLAKDYNAAIILLTIDEQGMGDPTSIGDYPDAMDNYDLVPSGLIKLIKQGFNAGLDHSGNEIGQPTHFFVGCALNLNPQDMAAHVCPPGNI